MITKLKLNQIKPNPDNPRTIRNEKFRQLVESIKAFPDMLEKRPLVVDEEHVVLGGNMRLKALEELKVKDVPVIVAKGWTEQQKREFIIKDNVSFGEWDWDVLANEWDDPLTDWGLDVWSPESDIHINIDDEDLDEELELIDEGGRKAIMIEYPLERYGYARELVDKARAQGQNIGELLIEMLEQYV